MSRLRNLRPDQGPHALVELRPSIEGCQVRARIDGAADQLSRTFVGAFGSRDEAASEAMGWALAWLRSLRGARASA